MNRRSFITKALAGLAAVPLIGKLAQAKPQLPPVYEGPVEYSEVKYVLGSYPPGLWPDISGNGNHWAVARGPVDLESLHIDGRKVFDRKCNERRRNLLMRIDR